MSPKILFLNGYCQNCWIASKRGHVEKEVKIGISISGEEIVTENM